MTACHRERRLAPQRSAGFSLLTAIFLLVVLAGLGAAMVAVSTSQQTGSALDMQGARAYQAARAGVEWGLFQKLRSNSCVSTGTTFALPAASTLAAFTVTVTCTETATPGLTGTSGFQIVACACNEPVAGTGCPNASPGIDYVQRVISVAF